MILTNDGHERVEVADIEALSRHVNEELDDSCAMFLLYRLNDKTKQFKPKYRHVLCKICISILHNHITMTK